MRRIPPHCMSLAVKPCNYVNNVLGAVESAAARAEVGIMLDMEGNVVESIIYNIFIVENGILYTSMRRTFYQVLPKGSS